MTDTSSTYRVASRIAHLVRKHPGETMGASRKRLASRDREDFVDGCALAIHLEWVARGEDDRLRPGRSQPASVGSTTRISERVTEALERLKASNPSELR